jgi:hypothetical protein
MLKKPLPKPGTEEWNEVVRAAALELCREDRLYPEVSLYFSRRGWRIGECEYFPYGEDAEEEHSEGTSDSKSDFINDVIAYLIEHSLTRLPKEDKLKEETEISKSNPPGKYHSRKGSSGLIIVGWNPLFPDEKGKWKGSLAITLLSNKGPEWHISWFGYPHFLVRSPKVAAYLDRYYPGNRTELMAALKQLEIGF